MRITGIPENAHEDDGHGQVKGALEAGFLYADDRPKRWATRRNVWVHGYWCWDWANSYEEIESFDALTGLLRTRPPHGNYGFRAGQRFYFLNVLEELDTPGEYYVDAEAGILYFWPPRAVRKAEALVSVIESPMISLTDVSHVTIRGLTLEAARGSGIEIEGGAGVRVAGCTLRCLGTNAVVVSGGTGHTVAGCDISAVGDSGVRVSGGDRRSLTPCGHVVHNNHIWDFSRWSRCYTPAVLMHGVGLRVSHNLIHHAPHTAILYHGNENVIEFNEIHHVTLETGDCGAIYTGRDFTARGNVIRHNYIHDTGGYGMGSMAVYLDDCVSGQIILGNIFARTTRAAFIGGGRDNIVENNIFVDCQPAVHLDGRGLSPAPVWSNMVYVTMKERLDEMQHHQPPYSERYPELARLDKLYEAHQGIPPGDNVVARNVCVGGRWMDIIWHAAPEHATVVHNMVNVDPCFVDAERGDFRIRPESPAWQIGFEQIPVGQIGLVQDEDRPDE